MNKLKNYIKKFLYLIIGAFIILSVAIIFNLKKKPMTQIPKVGEKPPIVGISNPTETDTPNEEIALKLDKKLEEILKDLN